VTGYHSFYRSPFHYIVLVDMALRILHCICNKTRVNTEIADAVARELQAAGHSVDSAVMKDVKSLDGYDAAVIGAPIYMERCWTNLGKFVSRNREGWQQSR
jgi:menaquinone-dependent protoporphyrinogen IX oxidase